MIITDSSIAFSSSHTLVEQREQRESLSWWGNGANSPPGEGGAEASPGAQLNLITAESASAKVSLSAEAMAAGRSAGTEGASSTSADADAMFDLKFSLLRMLVERLMGKEVTLCKPSEFCGEGEQLPAHAEFSTLPAPAETGQGWGLVYHYHESRYEAEMTEFNAVGTIRTQDGREISFDLFLNMSREVLETTDISLSAGDVLKDPLVVNFDGNAAQLTQNTFSFDLDMDGRQDQIAFVAPGSGFLALDKNGDGVINDGGELFGAESGDGFSELAVYDEDGNGWIDENDGVFSRLRIWEKDASGNDRLYGLLDLGVGAIYLDSVKTPFALKDNSGNLQGQIRDSGIFLHENGTVGTVQQLDLVV